MRDGFVPGKNGIPIPGQPGARIAAAIGRGA
jgi:hypothetical protein